MDGNFYVSLFYLFLCIRYDLPFHARKSNKKANVTWRCSVTERKEAKKCVEMRSIALLRSLRSFIGDSFVSNPAEMLRSSRESSVHQH